jgi:hypothetical protein
VTYFRPDPQEHARLFFDHYYPRLLQSTALAPDGWFAGTSARR